MKHKLALTAVIALVPLLTWLAICGMNPTAWRYDRALAALDAFQTAEGALRRNVLSARAGLLHTMTR